jgi:hypothetical protein
MGLPKQMRSECIPDGFGHYPANPSALAQGLKNAAGITIAHVIDGRPLDGFTWAFREEKSYNMDRNNIASRDRSKPVRNTPLT